MHVCIGITFLLIRMFCINPSMKINDYEVNFFMINNNVMTHVVFFLFRMRTSLKGTQQLKLVVLSSVPHVFNREH